MCGLPQNNRKFPGALPRALQRADIPLVKYSSSEVFREYALTHKADGERAFLVYSHDGEDGICALIHRDMSITPLTLISFKSAFLGTIFDVEIVKNERGALILIFDTLAVAGTAIHERAYHFRLDTARWFIRQHMCHGSEIQFETNDPPKYAHSNSGRDTTLKFATGPCSTIHLKMKHIFPAHYGGKLAEPSYSTDGYIWTCINSPYEFYNNDSLFCFKWKPPILLTIDFRVTTPDYTMKRVSFDGEQCKHSTDRGNFDLLVTHEGGESRFSAIEVHDDITSDSIYECRWDINKWILVKPRYDKKKPNHLNTVLHTIQCIEENVTLQELKDR